MNDLPSLADANLTSVKGRLYVAQTQLVRAGPMVDNVTRLDVVVAISAWIVVSSIVVPPLA